MKICSEKVIRNNCILFFKQHIKKNLLPNFSGFLRNFYRTIFKDNCGIDNNQDYNLVTRRFTRIT